RSSEHDGAAIGRPGRVEGLVAVSKPTAEAGLPRELRAREEIARFALRLERLDEKRRALLVEPSVPVPDGCEIVDPGVVLARLLLLGELAVLLVVGGLRIDIADEKQRAAIRAPFRCTRARRELRDTLRLSARDHVDDVDLRDFVILAPCGERDPATVGTPRGAALRATGPGQASRSAASVRARKPE